MATMERIIDREVRKKEILQDMEAEMAEEARARLLRDKAKKKRKQPKPVRIKEPEPLDERIEELNEKIDDIGLNQHALIRLVEEYIDKTDFVINQSDFTYKQRARERQARYRRKKIIQEILREKKRARKSKTD